MSNRPIIFSAPMVRALLEGRKTQHRLPINGGVPAAPSMDVHPDHVARHPAPYLDAYCSDRKTPANPRGMSSTWCWWTRDDRMGREFEVGFAPGDRLWVRETCRAEELSRPQRSRPATRRERQALGRTSVIECNMLDGADGVRYLADDQWIKIENSEAAGDAWSDLYHGRGGRGPCRGGNTVPSIHMPRWASRLTLVVTDVRVHRIRETTAEEALAEGLGPLCHPLGRTDLTWIGTPLVCAAPDYAFRKLWDERHGEGAWLADPFVVALSFAVHRANIDALPAASAEREPVDA